MTFDETMQALESAGTAQGRKIYRRHGAPDPMFGGSFAALNELRRKIKTDHALAQKLWATGNTDARNLATMIADDKVIRSAELDEWVSDPNSAFFAGLIARNIIIKTKFAHDKALAWIKSDHVGMATAGWLTISLGAKEAAIFEDEELLSLLRIIETKIHVEKNDVREAMNYAVIGIGIRNPTCRKAALATAKRIGVVNVDHGETGCKTPDATSYIKKTVAHHSAKAARKGKTRG